MNLSSILLEISVAALALIVLMGDLWLPSPHKRKLGYAAALGVLGILVWSVLGAPSTAPDASTFNGMIALDPLAIFFKQFFLLTAALILLIATEFADRLPAAISEFYSLILLALVGMLFAASANDFVMVFVSLELVSVTFYVLNSFQRTRLVSLEAGIKYLILSALSAGFLVFGIAFVFGATGSTQFETIREFVQNEGTHSPALIFGVVFVLVGLGFKVAAFPFQIWAPDVYQGSPTPATAFLAVGSKAVGIILMLRVLFAAVPQLAAHSAQLMLWIAAATIIYGNLCAIPQRNIKRLLGYSSVANTGYLLLGFAALNRAGVSAILFYLAGYLFTVIAAFAAISIVTRGHETEDISAFAGLGQRSPFLAGMLTLAMVSLAGIPPLAGFFGKFLLLKAAVERGAQEPLFYWLVGVSIVGVLVSIYCYFSVIRSMYWSKKVNDLSPIPVGWSTRFVLIVCALGMFYLGILPGKAIKMTDEAALALPSITAPIAKSAQAAPGSAHP